MTTTELKKRITYVGWEYEIDCKTTEVLLDGEYLTNIDQWYGEKEYKVHWIDSQSGIQALVNLSDIRINNLKNKLIETLVALEA